MISSNIANLFSNAATGTSNIHDAAIAGKAKKEATQAAQRAAKIEANRAKSASFLRYF